MDLANLEEGPGGVGTGIFSELALGVHLQRRPHVHVRINASLPRPTSRHGQDCCPAPGKGQADLNRDPSRPLLLPNPWRKSCPAFSPELLVPTARQPFQLTEASVALTAGTSSSGILSSKAEKPSAVLRLAIQPSSGLQLSTDAAIWQFYPPLISTINSSVFASPEVGDFEKQLYPSQSGNCGDARPAFGWRN